MTTATNAETRTARRCDRAQVRVGSVYSRHSHGTVTAVAPRQILLRNADGEEWGIDPDLLEKEFSFADQHDVIAEMSRTKVIAELMARPGMAMTVAFRKQVDPKAVALALRAGQAPGETERAFVKRVEALLDGEERVMAGYHNGSVNEHGRLEFIESGKGPRQIDPRTIEFVVAERTRFNVK